MNRSPSGVHSELPAESADFYRRAMEVLQEAEVPFLVGGAYAFACYTEITRHTKDFDLFLQEEDLDRALEAFAEAGDRTEITFPHWLAKVFAGDDSIDLIFRSGNGVSDVDARWFDRAEEREVLGETALLCPPEEIIWTKAFIQERERYDGADVSHLLLTCSECLDWDRLLYLFGSNWRVLFSHLVLFGFIYPSERDRIPRAVMDQLLGRLEQEFASAPPAARVCRGTLLSRAQYLVDIEDWEFEDARLHPRGGMTEKEVTDWTEAIEEEHLPESSAEQE